MGQEFRISQRTEESMWYLLTEYEKEKEYNLSIRWVQKIGFPPIFDFGRVDFFFERRRNAVHCN